MHFYTMQIRAIVQQMHNAKDSSCIDNEDNQDKGQECPED